MAADLAPAAAAAARCLGLGPGDDVLIICNAPQRAIADALTAAAASPARAVELLEYPSQTRHGQEPPALVGRAMLRATAVFAVTRFSLSHTRARLEATACGVRVASMPAISEEVFARALPTDYSLLERAGRELAQALSAANRCRLTSPSAGRITAASGRRARWLLRTLDAGGPAGRNIAELGIGTNPNAVLSGDICEDEKVAGTAHLAFGTNATFGGVQHAAVHIDGVVLRPRVELDGRSILSSGSTRAA